MAIQKEEIQFMYQCLRKCTFDQSTVLVMRYLHDLSISETAEVLNWTESKVKTTQHRALKVLKKHMEEMMSKEGMSDEKVRVER